MRTVSATLEAAAKSTSALAYVKVLIRNRIGAAQRLVWTRLYTGTEEDYYHSMTMPADGSLIRARVKSATDGVFVQRVTAPGPSSTYSTWTNVTSPVSAGGTALASSGANVFHAWVSDDPYAVMGTRVYARESSDSGATWGAPALVVDINTPEPTDWLYHIAAGMNPAGDTRLFYGTNYPYVYIMRKPAGGAWDAVPTQLNWAGVTFATVRGVAIAWDAATSKWNCLMTGITSDGVMHLYAFTYEDGVGASALVDIWSTGASVTYRTPYLYKPDVWRFSATESNALDHRVHHSHSLPTAAFLDNLWREPVPFNRSSQHGLALAGTATYAWATSPDGVWRAPLNVADVDVTSRVISLSQDIKAHSGGALVELENSDGYFAGFDYKGCELQISPGYKTTAGAEYSTGPSAYINAWEFLCQGARATVQVIAGSHWELMDGVRATRTIRWTGADTLDDIIRSILARTGLDLVVASASTLCTTLTPAFVIHPGDSMATALKRALTLVQDVLLFREDVARLKNPTSSDASDYAYGSGSPVHPILEGKFLQLAQPVNRAQVYPIQSQI